jgi:hypothetical protein
MIVRDAVTTVRSLLTGALLDETSVLAEPYDPQTNESITLKYPKRSLAQGSVICAGLNTFMAMQVSGDGAQIAVLPSMDGGPAVAVPAGTIVNVRPQFTTWAIFREMQAEIDAMSSRDVGLYAPTAYQFDYVDRHNGTYPITLEPGQGTPFRLVKAEYRVSGIDAWYTFTEAEFQQEAMTVRVFCDPAAVVAYKFTLAHTFGQMNDLDSDLSVVGVTDFLTDVPIYGAASTMALGWEGRRVQPFSMGDSRRANEVNVGSNTSLSRMWRLRQQEAVNAELSRLTGEYGWRQPIATGPTVVGYRNLGSWGGWR